MLRFTGAGVTDVGLVRPHNEDSGFVGPYVALVADGVGGAASGEVASASAAYAASAVALSRRFEDPERVILDAAVAAGDSVRLGVQRDLTRLGMATTLTMVVTDGVRVVLGHVGDSRAYQLRGGELTRVSTDHTYVQRLVDRGQLAVDQIPRHPWRNVVLRSVDGDPAALGVDVVPLDVGVGDRLLLCSDGLTDLVGEGRIAQVLRAQEPEAAATTLTGEALAAGGRDNITCIVLDLVDGPAISGDGVLLGAVRDLVNVADPSAVRLG